MSVTFPQKIRDAQCYKQLFQNEEELERHNNVQTKISSVYVLDCTIGLYNDVTISWLANKI